MPAHLPDFVTSRCPRGKFSNHFSLFMLIPPAISSSLMTQHHQHADDSAIFLARPLSEFLLPYPTDCSTSALWYVIGTTHLISKSEPLNNPQPSTAPCWINGGLIPLVAQVKNLELSWLLLIFHSLHSIQGQILKALSTKYTQNPTLPHHCPCLALVQVNGTTHLDYSRNLVSPL